jgi:hypothetical protein
VPIKVCFVCVVIVVHLFLMKIFESLP